MIEAKLGQIFEGESKRNPRQDVQPRFAGPHKLTLVSVAASNLLKFHSLLFSAPKLNSEV